MAKRILRAAALIFLVTQSQAATLEFQGAVAVDRGSGFSPVSNYARVDGGDRVRALKGCAKILYDNGYSAKVRDGQVAVVFSTSPEYVASGSLKDAPAVPMAPQTSDSDLPLAGLLIAAGTGVAVAITTAGNNNRAASP